MVAPMTPPSTKLFGAPPMTFGAPTAENSWSPVPGEGRELVDPQFQRLIVRRAEKIRARCRAAVAARLPGIA